MATLTSDIITLLQQKQRNKNSTAIGLPEKLNAIQEVLNDLNREELLPGTIRTSYVEYGDTLTDYPAPSDFKGFVEAEPENSISYPEIVEPEEFQQASNEGVANIIASDWRDTDIVWRLKANVKTKYIALNLANSATGNGTWTANTTTSDATNVKTDINVFKGSIGGSVSFDIDVSQSVNNYAEVSITNMSSVDLSNHDGRALELFDFFIPDATYITSVDLFWGSGTGAYWTVNQTARADGASFSSGWNPLRMKWVGLTPTGSPVNTAITFIRVRVNYSASQGDLANFRISFFRSSPIEVIPIKYASTSTARNSTGTFITKLTSNADTDRMLFSGKNDALVDIIVYGASGILSDNQGNENDFIRNDKIYQRMKEQLYALNPPRTKMPQRRTRFYVSSLDYN